MPYTMQKPPATIKNIPKGAQKIWINTFNAVAKDTKDENKARQAAWSNVKNKYKKVGDKWVPKAALVEVSLYITKASMQKDGTMRWQATCSDTTKDQVGQATTLQLFNDWINRAETGQTVAWLPPPRVPFLGLSHYPDLEGFGEAGLTDKMYVQGNQFKAKGEFHKDDDYPLGKALFEAVAQEKALIEKGEAIEQPIRISAGWWDISHRHGDFIFERKSLDDICPMCNNGNKAEFFLKGQLDHFAATRVPINPRTDLALEEKAMTTRKQDASTIIKDAALVEELDQKAAALTGKSETEEELPPGMVVRAEDEPDTEQMMDGEVEIEVNVEAEKWLPFGGAISLAEAEQYMAAQEQVGQVYTEWSLFRTVMDNVLETSDPGEIKSRVSGLINEFSSRVDAIKASVEDVYLVQAKGVVNMSEQVTPPETPVEDFDLQTAVDAALNNAQFNREQKAEAIQKAFETYAQVIRSQLDKVAPPDPGEAIQKAMMPVLEKLDLIASKMGAPQLAQAPVQKSLMPDGTPIPTNQNQLPISPITKQPSALRAMVERSVGVQ